MGSSHSRRIVQLFNQERQARPHCAGSSSEVASALRLPLESPSSESALVQAEDKCHKVLESSSEIRRLCEVQLLSSSLMSRTVQGTSSGTPLLRHYSCWSAPVQKPSHRRNSSGLSASSTNSASAPCELRLTTAWRSCCFGRVQGLPLHGGVAPGVLLRRGAPCAVPACSRTARVNRNGVLPILQDGHRD